MVWCPERKENRRPTDGCRRGVVACGWLCARAPGFVSCAFIGIILYSICMYQVFIFLACTRRSSGGAFHFFWRLALGGGGGMAPSQRRKVLGAAGEC